MSPNREELIKKIKATVPNETGVYQFYNKDGRVIYVGKSVKLRSRVLSYLQNNSNSQDLRIKQMIHNIADVSFMNTETELLALLLEDALIKQLQPFYNVKQKEYNEYQYLWLSSDPYPTLKMIDHSTDFDGGTLFGPFTDRYFVEVVLAIIYPYFHLRSCKEPSPVNRCINFEIGRCPGPCRNEISIANYRDIVDRTINFLKGETESIVQILKSEMKMNAAAREFEKAAINKEQIRFCKTFGKRQKFFNQFKSKNLIIRETPSKVTYLFQKGDLISPSITRESISDPRFILDRAKIVYTWLHSKKNECTYFFE